VRQAALLDIHVPLSLIVENFAHSVGIVQEIAVAAEAELAVPIVDIAQLSWALVAPTEDIAQPLLALVAPIVDIARLSLAVNADH
jgi:hypothetical protein